LFKNLINRREKYKKSKKQKGEASMKKRKEKKERIEKKKKTVNNGSKYHEDWQKVLKTHYQGLLAFTILKNRKRVFGIVRLIEKYRLLIGSQRISKHNPISYCCVRMNKLLKK